MPMALSTQQGLEDSQYLLLAKIDNARNVSNILKAIHFKDVRMKCFSSKQVLAFLKYLICSLLVSIFFISTVKYLKA